MEENGDVEGLIHALKDDAENVRKEAMNALERIGDSRATEPLIELLLDPDITIQEEAITALGRIQDKRAIQPLIQNLTNLHIGIRCRAAEALGKIGDSKATEPLIQTLHDPDKTIQEMAITALGRIAVDPFVQDLSSEDQELKERAIISLNHLRELGMDEYLPNNGEAVEEDKDTSTDEIVIEKDQRKHDLVKKTCRYGGASGHNRRRRHRYIRDCLVPAGFKTVQPFFCRSELLAEQRFERQPGHGGRVR